MSMREEFENWIWDKFGKDYWLDTSSVDVFIRRGEGYLTEFLNVRWEAWQASRAALVVQLPKVIIDDDMNKAEWEAARDMRERCEEAIQAAGVQVKP